MYLEKLETHGFKTFAQKTILEFLPPARGKRGITAIVGPNGSGKSNLADAARWSLGEQSLKLLRGKKSEDVIFSGTEKRARSGLAEVSLTFNNEDKAMPIDLSSVTITRRLYREGNSEYLLNHKTVRLSDIQILLAQANFGQRTYSVIGQGMVDHVLVATPQERKEFFDEAAGVKQFEIKRNQAVNKLETTHDNLLQVQTVLQEIEPRLRSLNRQMKRLEQRGPLEEELKNLGRAYYGSLWSGLENELKQTRGQANEIELRRTKKSRELDLLRRELEAMEKEEIRATGFLDLQKDYEALTGQRNRTHEEILKIQHSIALAKMEIKTPDSLPATRLLQELEELTNEQAKIIEQMIQVKKLEDLQPIRKNLEAAHARAKTLLSSLTAKDNSGVIDPALFEKQKNFEKEISALGIKIKEIQEKINNYAKEEREQKGKFFAIQRQWEGKQSQLAAIDAEANNARVELAKIETRREGLIHEIKLEMNGLPEQVLSGELPKLEFSPAEAAERFRRIKTQLEMIGSIDPETMAEYDEIKNRYDFLTLQTEDLQKAINDLESGVLELDRLIEEKAESAFGLINQEFTKYFKRLFGGGQASLSKVETPPEESEETTETEMSQIKNTVNDPEKTKKHFTKKQSYNGVEIQATPPGKRLKSINSLSGGERALTSIALICAIMSSNPSPFVILDEVDAALDESNSIRFAEIVDELANQTQFIIITHNRATMHKANVLYGVTMGDDGISRLLSLKLEEAEEIRNNN